MSKKEKSISDQDRSEELHKLGKKLKAAQKARQPDVDEDRTAWAVGMNYASVFTGAVIVGGGFGFAVDHFTNTKPWGLALGIMLGFAAGTRSIVQMAKQMSEEDA